MRYSDDLIEEVRQRNDIVDVISMYVKLQKRGANYVGLCPFHSEKTPSFSVSANKQMYYCFGCGVGGNVFTFLMEYENYSFLEALRTLAERAGITLPEAVMSEAEKQQADLKTTLLDINKAAAYFYCYQLKTSVGAKGMQYFQNRGLSEETIKHFGLGYSTSVGGLYAYLRNKGYRDEILKQSGLFTFDERRGVSDKFWNRVMYPIMNVNNRVIGFGGRVMGDGEPKYLNSPETKVFDKSRNLYGLNYARSSREKYMLLCEGYMDVIAMHQAGFTNAVASLGTAFTGLQANLLKRYTDQVYLVYDSDGAGTKAALRAIPILKDAGITAKVIRLTPYKDPDEFIKNLGEEEFRTRIEDAQNSFYFELSVLERDFDMNDPEQKTRFYNEVAKKLLHFEEELERGNYIDAVARRYQIRSEDLKKLVAHHAAKQLGVPERTSYEERSKAKKDRDENGLTQSYQLMITWLVDSPQIFRQLQKFLSPEDFLEEPYHKVAELLWKQLMEEEHLNPAKILSSFESKEEQNMAAKLMNHPLEENLNEKEREKALNEMVRRIKTNRINHLVRSAASTEELQLLIQEQAKLQKLHISLTNG